MSTSLKVENFGISDIGFVRNNNEDVWAVLPEKQLFILADGMGGHNAGEVAASIAVDYLLQAAHELSAYASREEVCQFLRKALANANAVVLKEALHCSEYAGMGTTLSCFVIVENFLIYAHVGDSRLYRYRQKLDQLTEDHSVRRELPPPKTTRHMITRAIGAHSNLLPDIGVIPLFPNDLYMLCSDGLSDYVDKRQLTELLASPLPLADIGKKCVKAALEKGGNDNITLLLARVHQ